MFSSPGTPRRPQTATERLTSVRSNLSQLRESVQVSETFALAHLTSNVSASHPPQPKTTSVGSRAKVAPQPTPPAAAHRSVPEEPTHFASPRLNNQLHPPAATLNVFDDVVISLKQHAIKIEEHLAVEAAARQEMDRKLKSLVDQKVREELIRLEKKASDRIAELHHHVETLARRSEALQVELTTERDKNVRLTQELKFHVAHGVADVREHVTQVRTVCQASQSILAKNLSENVLRLQEKLDVERHARESVLAAVREEMHHASRSRDKTDDRALQKLRDDVSALEVHLRRERETRERGEEQLAATMEEVVAQIQLGLRNVTR
jgi:hypothetical protein